VSKCIASSCSTTLQVFVFVLLNISHRRYSPQLLNVLLCLAMVVQLLAALIVVQFVKLRGYTLIQRYLTLFAAVVRLRILLSGQVLLTGVVQVEFVVVGFCE